MPKKTVKRMTIKPPAGIKHKKATKKTIKRGGVIPAALIPVLAAAGIPVASALGNETVKGIKYGVKKIRSLLGIGVIRTGNTRAQGGRKVKKIIVRV